MDTGTISMRRLRGILAEEKISYTRFAAACGISRPYVGRILAGTIEPGELAQIKISRAVESLGLERDVEAQHAS